MMSVTIILIIYTFAKFMLTGTSSHVRPSSVRPALFSRRQVVRFLRCLCAYIASSAWESNASMVIAEFESAWMIPKLKDKAYPRST